MIVIVIVVVVVLELESQWQGEPRVRAWHLRALGERTWLKVGHTRTYWGARRQARRWARTAGYRIVREVVL